MNPIHKKLATVLVSSFRHINTSIISVEEYVSTLGTVFKPFTIGNTQYWLNQTARCQEVYIWDGSVLMNTVLTLQGYEVMYLTEGCDAVNKEGLYFNELIARYVLTTELREEMEGAAQDLKDYLRSRCKRVTLNEDGSISHS